MLNAQVKGPRTQAQMFSKFFFFFRRFPKNKNKIKGLQKKILLVLELSSRSLYVQAFADNLAVLVTRGAETQGGWENISLQ